MDLYSCCAVVQKCQKCLLFIIIHIFGTRFAINVLFEQLQNVNKLWNNKRTMHVNKQSQNENKTKSHHIQIDHTFCSSILPKNNTIVSLKDGFTV